MSFKEVRHQLAVITYLILAVALLLPARNFAQQKNIPLNRSSFIETESTILLPDTDNTKEPPVITHKLYHTSFKPLIESNLPQQEKTISERRLLYKKIKSESLFIVTDTTDKFHLTIDPLFNLELGTDKEDSTGQRLYKNTRGILVRGDIGNNFSFESSFYENQATFPNYINSFNEAYLVVPGQGRWKKFKTSGYDFAMSSGYISYSPPLKNKNWTSNIQLGHGKHFIGDGYRSLLLSDNAFNYPYLRATTRYKKFQYTNLYTLFMNLNDGGVTTPPNTERLFQKKCASFHYLSWNAHKRIQVGVFQGMIWKASDNRNKHHLNFLYVNPVIGANAMAFGMRGTNNILLGSTAKIILLPTLYIYGQYLLDDIAQNNIKGSVNNKQGLQGGVKYFDAFKIKNLHLQWEYNRVRPYTYAHKKPAQSYSHYNQPLSHPLSANFKETVGILNYRLKDFFTQFKINYALVGRDSASNNYGNIIFNSDLSAFYGVNSTINKQNQGIAATITNIDIQLGYIINPATNMNIIAGILNRKESYGDKTNNTNYIYVGFRTSLSNIYYDF